MIEVRCAGCGRRIGYSAGSASQRYKQWCSQACPLDGEVTSTSERSDLWLAMYDAGMEVPAIADLWEANRGYVHKVIAARRTRQA